MGTSEEASRRNVHEGLRRLRREFGRRPHVFGDRRVPGGMNVKEVTPEWERIRARLAAEAEAEGLIDVAVERHESPLGTLLVAATEDGLRPARAAGGRRRGGTRRARREDLAAGF